MSAAPDDLADRRCVPCRGGTPPFGPGEIAPLLGRLEGWTCVADHHLEKRYRVADFRAALALAGRLGRMSDAEGHHPELCLGWGWVVARIWTHKIDGLTESDFVWAAKADRVAASPADA